MVHFSETKCDECQQQRVLVYREFPGDDECPQRIAECINCGFETYTEEEDDE